MENRWIKLNEFRTSRAGVILFYSYLVAILITGILVGFGINYLIHLANQNRRALCSLQNSYKEDLDGTKKLIKEHPNGFPTLGITRTDLLRQKDTLQKRVDSLDDVDC
jgi:hypothetical protein